MAGETLQNPVKFYKAALGGNIIPGDVLELADGTYNAANMFIEGTAENPVIVRPANPGMVKIDGWMFVDCQHVHFYDIEFFDSNPNRYVVTNSVVANYGTNCFYGCYFHDEHTSGLNWFGTGAGEVMECVFLNNGNYFPDNSKHGHCLYTHNSGGGLRKIARNIFGYAMGNYALHIYSNSAALKDYQVEDNITVGQPTHTGGPGGLTDFVFSRNIQMGGYMQMGRYGAATNGTITDNELFRVGTYWANTDWVNLTESGNNVYNGQPASRDGYTIQADPQTWSRVIPFSKSARWLASVAAYNRDSAETIPIDFSGLANGDYTLINAQNMNETWDFTNSGSPVNVPMTGWTCAQRIGDVAPDTTFPLYGAFILVRQ